MGRVNKVHVAATVEDSEVSLAKSTPGAGLSPLLRTLLCQKGQDTEYREQFPRVLEQFDPEQFDPGEKFTHYLPCLLVSEAHRLSAELESQREGKLRHFGSPSQVGGVDVLTDH